MNNYTSEEIKQLALSVNQKLKQDEEYRRQIKQDIEIAWQEWLREKIREKIIEIKGWVDDQLIERVRNFLIRKGYLG